jgi:hypothetical protein
MDSEQQPGSSAAVRFGPVNSAIPRAGQRARNRSTLAVESLLEGEAEALTRNAIQRAIADETTALRLRKERLGPRARIA